MRDAKSYFDAKHSFEQAPTVETAEAFLQEASKFHGRILTADKDYVDMHMTR